MRNRYSGTCFICHQSVPVGAGWFQQNHSHKRLEGGKRGSAVPTATIADAGKWLLRCLACKGKGNAPQ